MVTLSGVLAALPVSMIVRGTLCGDSLSSWDASECWVPGKIPSVGVADAAKIPPLPASPKMLLFSRRCELLKPPTAVPELLSVVVSMACR